jgi:hypothetical protein
VFSAESSIGFINGVLGQLAMDDETIQNLHMLKRDQEQDV